MTTPASSVSQALARTRASYDATPYELFPLVRQQPARMAAAALWFGLTAPSVARARVLEIGCAAGGHIIPLAAAWPDAEFVGVDLSAVQIAQGKARVARLELANIELSARSLDEISAKDGAFDFIICHGVFSWIAEPLRDALLRVIAERLAPEGVAAVSFNVLPGWRSFQIARDSLLLHARLQNEPDSRARQARELFDLMSAESNDRYSYGRFWRDEARRMAAGGDAYIAHEVFEDENSPSPSPISAPPSTGTALPILASATSRRTLKRAWPTRARRAFAELLARRRSGARAIYRYFQRPRLPRSARRPWAPGPGDRQGGPDRPDGRFPFRSRRSRSVAPAFRGARGLAHRRGERRNPRRGGSRRDRLRTARRPPAGLIDSGGHGARRGDGAQPARPYRGRARPARSSWATAPSRPSRWPAPRGCPNALERGRSPRWTPRSAIRRRASATRRSSSSRCSDSICRCSTERAPATIWSPT